MGKHLREFPRQQFFLTYLMSIPSYNLILKFKSRYVIFLLAQRLLVNVAQKNKKLFFIEFCHLLTLFHKIAGRYNERILLTKQCSWIKQPLNVFTTKISLVETKLQLALISYTKRIRWVYQSSQCSSRSRRRRLLLYFFFNF